MSEPREGTTLINQHITNNTHWTRKLFVGAGALVLAAALVPGAFVSQVRAMECANAGNQTIAPNDDGQADNTACGNAAVSTGGVGSTALGASANANGPESTAVGSNAHAGHEETTAVGISAQATKEDSTALGAFAKATFDSSTALGNRAQANADGSVALGASSVADQMNTVSVGNPNLGITRRITNVAMGAEDNDVVTVKQLTKSLKKSFRRDRAIVVKGKIETPVPMSDQDQASTTLAKTQASTTQIKSASSSASSSSAGPATVSHSSFDQFVSRTETQIDQLAQRDNKLAEGIAVVAALAQPLLLPGQHFAMRAGWGGYDDASAVAFSAAGVVADNLLRSGRGTLSLDGGVGWGTDEGEVVGRAGMTFGW